MTPRSQPVWLVTAVLAVAFWCTEHNLMTSAQEMYGTTTEVLESGASGGVKVANVAGFILVGGLGAWLLVAPGGRQLRPVGLLPAGVLLFVGWCLASSLWAIDPPRTIKRVGILVLCVAGAAGVARQVTPRDLCRLVLALTAGYAAVGLGAEVALGTFRPGGPDYRFAGTMHPNGQGANCALLCVAGLCLLPTVTGRDRQWLLAALAAGGLLLLLTKSRTSILALGCGLLAVRCARPTRGMAWAATAAVWAAAWVTTGVGAVAAVSGFDAGQAIADVVFLGRAEHVTTLTGRTELWEELAVYAGVRPAVGYGYGGFWTPHHIEEVSAAVFWGLDSAHSVYLDLVLSVGLIGAGLFVGTALVMVGRAVRAHRRAADPGTAMALALAAYGLVDGLTEAGFLMPSFITFVAGCGLCRLAFFDREGGE